MILFKIYVEIFKVLNVNIYKFVTGMVGDMLLISWNDGIVE